MPQPTPESLPQQEDILHLECNLDDMTAEGLAYALEQVMGAGALDAWFTPIVMKKGRPATLFSVLCRPADGVALRQLLLRETSTLGVRWQVLQRDVAERRVDWVQTPWGAVQRKIKILGGQVASVKPEYEDCARLAREHGVTLQQVMRAALEAGEP
jgi:pyridinium-3,5-bisthiocarboxylic acid mononucleotide nickel chelatase